MSFDELMGSLFEEEFGDKLQALKTKTKAYLDLDLSKGTMRNLDQLVDDVRLESDKPVDDGLVLLMSVM